jgi:hypothetical protein
MADREFRHDKEAKPHPGKLTARALLTPKHLELRREIGEARRALRETIAGSNMSPLLTLLDIANSNEATIDQRITAAGIACRYVHPALSATAISTEHRTVDASHAMASLHAQLDRLAAPAPIEAVAEPVSVLPLQT